MSARTGAWNGATIERRLSLFVNFHWATRVPNRRAKKGTENVLERRGWLAGRQALGAPGSQAPGGEGAPGALGLGEPVGDDGQRGGVVAHSAVTALDDDVLAPRSLLLEAAPPGDDAVAPAEDRGGRDRQRLPELRGEIASIGAAAPAQEARDVAGGGIPKGTRQRDHLTDVCGHAARQLARVDAAEAPAGEARGTAGAAQQLRAQLVAR